MRIHYYVSPEVLCGKPTLTDDEREELTTLNAWLQVAKREKYLIADDIRLRIREIIANAWQKQFGVGIPALTSEQQGLIRDYFKRSWWSNKVPKLLPHLAKYLEQRLGTLVTFENEHEGILYGQLPNGQNAIIARWCPEGARLPNLDEMQTLINARRMLCAREASWPIFLGGIIGLYLYQVAKSHFGLGVVLPDWVDLFALMASMLLLAFLMFAVRKSWFALRRWFFGKRHPNIAWAI